MLFVCLELQLLFDHNFGFDGGALALYSESNLRLHNNVSIKFQENRARTKGGAIYQINDNDIVPYCYYYKRVLILANIGDLVITAKFCARY